MDRECSKWNRFSITDPCDQIVEWFAWVFRRTSAPCYGPSLTADVSELPMVGRNGHLVTDLRLAIKESLLSISKNKNPQKVYRLFKVF